MTNDSPIFQHSVLSEIDTLVAWVDAGAPSGDLAALLPVPTFSDGWQLGPPDHIVRLPEVTVPADGNDYYPDVQFKMDVSEQRWIRAIEIRPSNRSVTHHSVIFTNGNPNTSGASGFFDILAVWSVGTNPHVFPEGMGRWVYPDQQLRVNAHYHPSGQVETDVTEIGLYFGEGDWQRSEPSSRDLGTRALEVARSGHLAPSCTRTVTGNTATMSRVTSGEPEMVTSRRRGRWAADLTFDAAPSIIVVGGCL